MEDIWNKNGHITAGELTIISGIITLKIDYNY